MSDCSPLRPAENGNSSSPSDSSGDSRASRVAQEEDLKKPLKKKHHQKRSKNEDNQLHRSHHVTNTNRARGQPQGRSLAVSDENQERTRSNSESSKGSGQLRYGARNVIELFIPVSICMLIVVGTMKATDSYHYSSQTVIWYAQVMFTDQTVDTGTRVWQSFANALIMLVMIVVMTTVLILLYKFRCYKTIHGWLILSSLILLFMFAVMYIAEILKVYNIPMDIYTVMIFIWNFGVVGMVCIHWKGPLLLQQAYLITISALLALVFIRSLPDWTTWTVLGIVSIWDLVAVLCPRGPLRILVETAQERNEPIFPALIYSSTMLWEVVTTAIVVTTPIISMADKKSKRSNRGTSDERNPSAIRTGYQPAPGPSSSTANRSRTTRVDMGTPTKRSRHPVEIHYDSGAQTPEVDIIQPSVSSASDTWIEPVVRTIDTLGAPDRIVSRGGLSSARMASENGPVETHVDFHPQGSQIGANENVQLEEERGVKLGLGDFIFFSLLVGKASSYGDWVITLSCYVAILVGLCLTLSLLAVFRKALPALPISIAFGLTSLFMSYMFAASFAEKLSLNQVFI